MEEEEHDDSVEEFPGLFTDGPNYPSDHEVGESGSEKAVKKDILKEKKEKKKDISYSTLDGESSAEEMDLFDSKNSGKCRKTKSFKFLQKKERDERDDKKKKDDKDDKKKEKQKEKEVRKREKEEKRKIKKDKKKKLLQDDEDCFPIFGVPLSLAVERCPSHDGIRLPAIVRQCIDFIEEKGLSCEGIYRIGGVKSKVQSLRRAFNFGEIVLLDDQHPHVVASLLKLFLRELPETVLTVDMMPHFEDVSLIPNPKERAEAMRQLIDRLPTTNRLLLQYVLKHMGNVVEKELENKMSYQNICVVLSPTIQISHRVLNVMFHSHQYLFGKVSIKKYVPPITSCSAEVRSIEELNSPKLIEEELNKQESLLACLHAAVASGRICRKTEEQLWEAQRNHTLLKRRLKIYDRRDSISNGGSESSQEKLYIRSESLDKTHVSVKLPSCQDDKNVESVATKLARDESKKNSITETLSSQSVPSPNVIVQKIESDKYYDCSLAQDNVTIVSIGKSESETGNKEICVPVSFPVTKEVIIPVLPKPISVRAARNKLYQEPKQPSSPQKDSLPNMKGSESVPVSDKSEVSLPAMSDNISSVIIKNSFHNQDVDCSVTSNDTNAQEIKNSEPNKSQINVDNVNSNSIKFSAKKLNPIRAKWSEQDFVVLLKEELRLKFEHDERLAMNQELTKKLKAEKSEISRLKDEIQEMQTIYGYRTHSYDSSESDGSDSDGESDSEEDILSQISSLDLKNDKIQSENAAIVKKIGEEREAVIHLKVALREAKFQQNRNLQSQGTAVVS